MFLKAPVFSSTWSQQTTDVLIELLVTCEVHCHCFRIGNAVAWNNEENKEKQLFFAIIQKVPHETTGLILAKPSG